jgi:hypothetical protein
VSGRQQFEHKKFLIWRLRSASTLDDQWGLHAALQQMLLIGASMLTVVALAQPGGGALVSVLARGIPHLRNAKWGLGVP